MADSTKAVVVKAGDGTVVPSTFFTDNAAALRAALVLTNITEIAWDASKGGIHNFRNWQEMVQAAARYEKMR